MEVVQGAVQILLFRHGSPRMWSRSSRGHSAMGANCVGVHCGCLLNGIRCPAPSLVDLEFRVPGSHGDRKYALRHLEHTLPSSNRVQPQQDLNECSRPIRFHLVSSDSH